LELFQDFGSVGPKVAVLRQHQLVEVFCANLFDTNLYVLLLLLLSLELRIGFWYFDNYVGRLSCNLRNANLCLMRDPQKIGFN
jgi:hypothetical protein